MVNSGALENVDWTGKGGAEYDSMHHSLQQAEQELEALTKLVEAYEKCAVLSRSIVVTPTTLWSVTAVILATFAILMVLALLLGNGFVHG